MLCPATADRMPPYLCPLSRIRRARNSGVTVCKQDLAQSGLNVQKGYELDDTQAVNNSSEEKIELSSQRKVGKKRRSFRRREKHLILCPGPYVVSQR
jgi:hypothetical protein